MTSEVNPHVRHVRYPRCYACTVRVDHPTPRRLGTFQLYEAAVEWIEDRSPGDRFSRVNVWRGIGIGPASYNAIGLVLVDMQLHGLIERAERGVYVKTHLGSVAPLCIV